MYKNNKPLSEDEQTELRIQITLDRIKKRTKIMDFIDSQLKTLRSMINKCGNLNFIDDISDKIQDVMRYVGDNYLVGEK